MEFEEIENGIKAKIPLITEEDIRVIDNDFDGIVNLSSIFCFNSIPKKKIEDKLKQLNSEIQYCARQNGRTIKLGKIMALQELLEEDK